MEIDGRVAIVTGAAVGTGRAIARRLAADGAAVVLADVDVAGGEKTRHLIEAEGGRAAVVAVDMRSGSDVESMVDFAVSRFDGVHILVNNAGGGGHIPPHFPEATAEQWGSLLDLNLRGPMLATQLALAPMRRAGGGVVVNVSSTAGLDGRPYQSPEYAAAKAGLIRFTSSLGGLPGVRVTCVVPDWVGTERAQRELAAMSPQERAAAPGFVPLDDLSAAVVHLIRVDTLAGSVMVLRPGRAAELLAP
jgi:NAD(P)-dependent dehydrogenase (short-subunit alcohol dehydrogenase family)